MHMQSPPRATPRAAAALLALLLGLGACASQLTPPSAPAPSASVEPTATAEPSPTATDTPGASPSATATASASASPGTNACPDVGCQVRIVSVTAAAGGELTLDLEANYAADVSANHFHVYWDHFTAQQVSDDAERRFGVSPGDWVPTGDDPYTTADATSVTERVDSSRICVTAGDRDHNVIDPKLYQCTDVSAFL